MLADATPFDVITVVGILGAVMGSFLGTLLLRLPVGRPVVLARSCCDTCGVRLAPWQLIPLLGWLAQGGKCRTCGHNISWFFPAVEIAGASVALSAVLSDAPLLPSLILGWALLALAINDLRTFRLNSALVISLMVLGLIVVEILDPGQLLDHLLGSAIGWTSFTLVAVGYRLLRGHDGLGKGDAKLFASAGAWLGWQGLVSVVLIASPAALVAILVQRVIGHKIGAGTKIAFGAYLCLGIWVVWLFGPIVL